MSGPARHRVPPILPVAMALALLCALAAPAGATGRGQVKKLSGKLVVVHEDPANGGYRYFLDRHGRMSEELRFPSPPGLRPNTPVEVSGVEQDGTLAVKGVRKLGTAEAPPTTTGTKQLLVILMSWGPSLATSRATATSFVFGTTDPARRSVTQYYTDVSYGQLTWTGQVTPVLSVADPGSCALNTIANAGDAAAANAGYTLANFDNRMYVFPDDACGSGGWGEVAASRTWIVDGLANIDSGYQRMVPDHELGHNLGAYHGHGLECGADTITRACITGAQGRSCDDGGAAPCISEYGNSFDVMGNNWTSDNNDAVNWFALWHGRRLGWVSGRVITDPQPAAAADHTFTVGPIEQQSGNVGLVLTTAAGHTYTVEYRQPIGQDAFLTRYPDATSGVLIARDDPVAGSDPGPIALDTSPDSNLAPYCTAGTYTAYCDWFDASLNVGATYTDVDGAFTLTVNAATTAGAGVTVHWAAAPSATSVGEMDPSVAYDGWTGAADPGASGGTDRVGTVKTEKAVWKSPSTTSVTWATFVGPNRGVAKVVIDGTVKGYVDLYAASAGPTTVTYGGLPGKAHNVVINVAGTKDAASSGYGVPVDAFVAGSATVQDTDPKIAYVTWKGSTSSSATGGTYRSSTASSARATFTFTGTAADWITTKGPSYGKAEVLIDGASRGTFDLYAAQNAWQTPIAFTGLSAGAHTLVVRPLGAKNASSSGTKVVVDGFTSYA